MASKNMESGESEKRYSEEDFKRFMEQPEETPLDFTEEWPAFLNNFYLEFPIPEEFRNEVFSSRYKHFDEKMEKRREADHQKTLRVTKKEFAEKYGESEKDPRWSPSELRLDQTEKQFKEALDQVLYSLYPDYDNLYRKAHEELIQEGNDTITGFGVIPKKLRHIVLDVFKKMREMGYNQYDLTA